MRKLLPLLFCALFACRTECIDAFQVGATKPDRLLHIEVDKSLFRKCMSKCDTKYAAEIKRHELWIQDHAESYK